MHAGAAARVTIRCGRADDEAALVAIDRATWSPYMTPMPKPGEAFFNERTQPENVVVAERDGAAVGYAKIEHPTPFPASDHVWEITGLAVDPAAQSAGLGRALMDALIKEARGRGGRRLTLRVFAVNERARRLYEQLGFQVEGILRSEFRVGDDYLDDVLMALDLTR